MKKTLAFLAIIFLSLSTNAECQYHYYHITFTFEANDGKIFNGYTAVSPCYFSVDSILNTEYLKRKLTSSTGDFYTEDSLTYFQDRIKYKIDENSEQKDTLYYLLNKRTIPTKKIKTIRIDNIVDQFGWVSISNDLQLKDTVWMKKEPIKRVVLEGASLEGYGIGFLIDYKIFIHANSKKIDTIIRELELKWKELVNEKTSNDIDDNVFEINEEIGEIIKKLNGEKVVVVSESSD